MKNTFGSSIAVTIFGESHGEEIGVVIDGLSPGIPVDREFINAQLALRRPAGKISTARQEQDEYRIVSGVFEDRTTGTPLCICIPNTQTRSKDYAATRALARPGHADFTAHVKYRGFEDYRGGGHFSGRITAGLVAGGAIALTALREKGIPFPEDAIREEEAEKALLELFRGHAGRTDLHPPVRLSRQEGGDGHA